MQVDPRQITGCGTAPPLGLILPTHPRAKSDHQRRVEKFMLLAGQDVPQTPTIPSEEIRRLRAMLILEETLETIDALGFCAEVTIAPYTQRMSKPFVVAHDRGPNLHEVVDGCCDIKVVTTGTLTAFGIADEGPQLAVDEANLAKFSLPTCRKCGREMLPYEENNCLCHCNCGSNLSEMTGHRAPSGKWIKPTTWQPPNWEQIIKSQVPTESVVVDESVVPVGPGDGLVRQAIEKIYPLDAYAGHVCPDCKTPLSDEAIKQLCLGKLSRFRCPNCLKGIGVSTEAFDRPTVVLL